VGCHAPEHCVFCSRTPARYKPPQQAFSLHISRGYTTQQNSQPVKYQWSKMLPHHPGESDIRRMVSPKTLSWALRSGQPPGTVWAVEAEPGEGHAGRHGQGCRGPWRGLARVGGWRFLRLGGILGRTLYQSHAHDSHIQRRQYFCGQERAT